MTPEQLATLKSFSQDTGAFRLTNAQAAKLADACAAAVKLAAAAEFAVEALSNPGAPTRTERQEIISQLQA